jgi:hypothetical protein
MTLDLPSSDGTAAFSAAVLGAGNADVCSLEPAGGCHGVDGAGIVPSGKSSIGEAIISPGAGNNIGRAPACPNARPTVSDVITNKMNQHATRINARYHKSHDHDSHYSH